jgi:radical SAM superfamily enzyme YgiQ (UPF0313 family)
MNILLYNPDNGVTRNYMPHLWMFLLQSLTPAGHRVFLIDANASPLTEEGMARYIKQNDIGLVGIGAMTRMAAKAYRMATAARNAGAKVVMGGPHVTEMPDEALGRDGGPQFADAVALGEADETWPQIVEDAARGALKPVYEPVDAFGKERKPPLDDYPVIPWDTIDIEQFNMIHHIPRAVRWTLERVGMTWKSFYLLPIESGRGCPYGCEFCTVTGFFGDKIRFRSNESVVNELLRIKQAEKERRGKIAVFIIDDNFAINVKRTKSLLRDMIAAGAQLPWVAQISINLLRDDELLDLIAESGGKWIFCGLESIDEDNLKSVAKGFNKPAEYRQVLERMAQRNIYAITSFIFGMDNDRVGVADRVLGEINSWPPVLPVFGHLTPYPGTPLYDKLFKAGRLNRPRHWMEFIPFEMSFDPTQMRSTDVHEELARAWGASYTAGANAEAMEKLADRPFHVRTNHLIARFAFRGIYFPQMRKREWVRLLLDNRQTIMGIAREVVALSRQRGPSLQRMRTPIRGA